MANIFNIIASKKYALEILFGISFSIILFDRFRFSGRIGLGEILLGLAVYCCLLILSLNFRKIKINNIGIKYTLLLNLFFLFCMVPNTIINSYYSPYAGSSLLELLAYLICFVTLLTISLLRLNPQIMGATTVFLVLLMCFAFLGDSDAWYGEVRYSGASDNPNRLAIYLLSSLVIISQLPIRAIYRFLLFLILSILIYITLSDASRLGFVAMILSFIFFSGLRSPYIAPIYFLVGFLLFIFIYLNLDALYIFVVDLWYAASTSNYRFNLIENGLVAWAVSPMSIIIGHGAGVFSGYAGPFEGWESHSNPIDLLTIGGISLSSLFYLPIIFSIFQFVKNNENFAASALIGLVIFSFFAFIGRHPIVWFVIYISLLNSSNLGNGNKKLMDH